MVLVLNKVCLMFMQTCSLLSIAVTSLLLPLIYFRSGKGIGNYRYLLFAYCIVTLLFAVITAVTVPVFSPTTEGWIMYATTNILPQNIGSWISVAACCCYSLQLVVIVLSFIYRYFVMCRREYLCWFHKKHLLPFLIIPALLVNFVWTGLTATFLRPTEEMNEIFRQRVYEMSGMNIRNVAYIAGVAYINEKIVWEFFSVFSCRIIICVISSSIVIFCTAKSISQFKKDTSFSSRQDKMAILQKKLFAILMFQTMIPLFLVFLPAICGYLFGFLRISAPQLTTIFSTALPFAQLIDPLMILLFIADYRRALVVFISSSVLHRSSTVSPSGTSSSSSGGKARLNPIRSRGVHYEARY